ncbi:MAG: amidohydrolase family protein [Candidatus Aminicenantia bacterium]
MVKKILIFLVFQCFLFSFLFAQDIPKFKKLYDFIENTKFIDVHSHPVTGHRKYEIEDPYPTLEPPIVRPFWVIPKDRIALFDSMEIEALKEIYGYKKEDVTREDIQELEELSLKFWSQGKRDGFNRILEICGIERVFSNSKDPEKELDRERVFWVPFVDQFFYPLQPSNLRSINPSLKRSLEGYYEEVRELSKKFGKEITDLENYLDFVEKVLVFYKNNGAVALKVASGYIRTLWFDEVEREEASKIFSDGLKEGISDWNRYKKLQDFIARKIFQTAGKLNLTVHFHTGFGASATLKNLDSNPLNLESVFSDMRFKGTTFLMLHGGYPFWDKLKPMLEKKNVYVEFSAINWFVFEDELSRILYEWLTYPGGSEKIMFGSDAGAPVFFWISAKNSRKALYKALSKLIKKGILNEEKAIKIAGKIMRTNAIKIHNLSD